MKKRPDVLKLELSPDMYSVDEEEMDILRKIHGIHAAVYEV